MTDMESLQDLETQVNNLVSSLPQYRPDFSRMELFPEYFNALGELQAKLVYLSSVVGALETVLSNQKLQLEIEIKKVEAESLGKEAEGTWWKKAESRAFLTSFGNRLQLRQVLTNLAAVRSLRDTLSQIHDTVGTWIFTLQTLLKTIPS